MHDHDSWTAAVKPLIPRLHAHAMRLAKDPDVAADVVSGTLLRAWANRATFREGAAVAPWINTILRNVFFTMAAGSSRRAATADKWAVGVELVTEPDDEALDSQARAETVRAVVDTLSPAHHEALRLREACDLSYSEISVELEIPIGTVMSRISRGREAFATRYVETQVAL